MTKQNSPIGRSLRSLTTQLTRWMRPRKKVTEVAEVTNGTEGVAKVKHITETKPKPKVIRSRPAPKPKIEPIVKEEPIIIAESFVPQDKPDLPAEAAAEEGPDLRSPISDLLQSFPENKNLVGQTEVIFTLDDKKHSLMIRTDCMYLDAQKYLVSANGGALGGDVELDILECKRAGHTLMLKVGAFGKDVMISLNSDETAAMFELLLKGKTSRHTADRGQVIEITRNNY